MLLKTLLRHRGLETAESPKAVVHTNTPLSHAEALRFSPLWFIDPLQSTSMRCRQHLCTQTAHNHDITLERIESCHR